MNTKLVCRKTFDDDMGSKAYDVYLGRKKVGEVYNSGPGRWSWIDRNGKPHRTGWSALGTRKEALAEIEQDVDEGLGFVNDADENPRWEPL